MRCTRCRRDTGYIAPHALPVRTRVELAAKVMTSKGSLTSARQISITARPSFYSPSSLLPMSPLSTAPSCSHRAFLLPRRVPPCVPLLAVIFDRTREMRVLSAVYLSADPKDKSCALLSIGSLSELHFMIDYRDCVCRLVLRDAAL